MPTPPPPPPPPPENVLPPLQISNPDLSKWHTAMHCSISLPNFYVLSPPPPPPPPLVIFSEINPEAATMCYPNAIYCCSLHAQDLVAASQYKECTPKPFHFASPSTPSPSTLMVSPSPVEMHPCHSAGIPSPLWTLL